jgi:hypothetical protein
MAPYPCPAAFEIDAAPIPFHGANLSEDVLFLHGFAGAASGVAAREKHRRVAVPFSNSNDAMSDQTSLGAIQDDVADAHLRYRFNRDGFAAAYRGMHAHAFGAEPHAAAAAQEFADDVNKQLGSRGGIHGCTL